MKYVCDVCGWEYDEEKGYPEGGIAPGTKWEDIPEDFECPLCLSLIHISFRFLLFCQEHCIIGNLRYAVIYMKQVKLVKQ